MDHKSLSLESLSLSRKSLNPILQILHVLFAVVFNCQGLKVLGKYKDLRLENKHKDKLVLEDNTGLQQSMTRLTY